MLSPVICGRPIGFVRFSANWCWLSGSSGVSGAHRSAFRAAQEIYADLTLFHASVSLLIFRVSRKMGRKPQNLTIQLKFTLLNTLLPAKVEFAKAAASIQRLFSVIRQNQVSIVSSSATDMLEKFGTTRSAPACSS